MQANSRHQCHSPQARDGVAEPLNRQRNRRHFILGLAVCWLGILILPVPAHALVLYNATRVENLPANMFDATLEIVYFDAIARPQSGSNWTDSVFCNLTADSVAGRLRDKYSNYTGIMMLDVESNTSTDDSGAYYYPCLATYELTPDDNFAAIPLYRAILEGARRAAPNAKIGFYGIPRSAMRVAFTEAGYEFSWAPPQTEEEYIRHEKAIYDQLTIHTDVLFPVAYWNGSWLDVYARAWQLQASAGMFLHWNRSIIFTVSPYKENACGFLDAASVRFQLNTLKSLDAAGIVYWVHEYESRKTPVPSWAQQNCHWPTQNKSIASQAEWFQNSMQNGISHTQYPDSQWMHEVEVFNRLD
jgi:hypothetical protein